MNGQANFPKVIPAWRGLKSYPTDKGRSGYLRMDFNEGPRPPLSLISEALSLCADALSSYPEYVMLRQAAAATFRVHPEAVMSFNGGDEGIFTLLRAFTGPAHPLLTPFPTFSMYQLYAAQCETPVIQVPMKAGFALDVEALIREIPKAAALALCSPNNPTGRAVPEGEVIQLLEASRGIPLIVDEIYAAFCGQDFAPLLARYPNLLLVRSLSKSHGMPGLRCGFVLGHPKVLAQLEALRPPFNVNALASLLGAQLLTSDKGLAQRLAQAVEARRRVQSSLEEAGIPCSPSDAHFFLADLGDRCQATVDFLKTRGILIKSISALPGQVRISISEAAHAEAFLSAFLPWWEGCRMGIKPEKVNPSC